MLTYGEEDDNDENLTLNENSSPRCQNEQKRDSQRKLRERENRRSSTFYSKSGGSLLEDTDTENEIEDLNIKGFESSPTITFEEKKSPKIAIAVVRAKATKRLPKQMSLLHHLYSDL